MNEINKMVGITTDVSKHKSLIHVAVYNDGVRGTFRSISYLERFWFKTQDGGKLY